MGILGSKNYYNQLINDLDILNISKLSLYNIDHLIKSGLNINSIDKIEKKTLLHHAVNHNNIELVNYLIKNKADLNIKDIFEETPLLLSIISKKNYEITELLVKSGADINLKSSISGSCMSGAILNRDWILCELLINYGANLEEYFYNRSILANAIIQNAPFSIIKLLVCSSKIDINSDQNGNTLAFFFTQNSITKSYEIFNQTLQFLIKQGLNLNKQNNDNDTALNYLIRTQLIDVEIISLFLKLGADPTIQNNANESPIDYLSRQVANGNRFYIKKLNLLKTYL